MSSHDDKKKDGMLILHEMTFGDPRLRTYHLFWDSLLLLLGNMWDQFNLKKEIQTEYYQHARIFNDRYRKRGWRILMLQDYIIKYDFFSNQHKTRTKVSAVTFKGKMFFERIVPPIEV